MMKSRIALAALLLAVAGHVTVLFAQAQKPPAKPAAAPPPASQAIARKWTGDLDGMIKRRMIRVLVPYSKTQYFIDRGVQRGLAYEAGRKFEDDLNATLKTSNLRVHVVFVPMSRDELFPALLDGRGDVVAAALTVTPSREKMVDFSIPTRKDVNQIVVTGPGAPAIAKVDDLAGREVFVRKSSAYFETLTALNTRFKNEGKKAITLKPAPETLEDEDQLEMANAGLVKIVVVDDYLAAFWKQIFPNIVVHDDVVVRSGGLIAPACRQNSPKLKAALDAFQKRFGTGTAFGNVVLQRYLKNTKFAKGATSAEDMKRFRQVMPATGKELGVGDIRQLEANINAGVKYVRFMMDRYFADEPMDRLNKGLFAFASYNAGPARIRQLRKVAAARGLDPNVWFNNVERIASEKIGRETVQYVANIYKYYIAYSLALGEMTERQRSKS